MAEFLQEVQRARARAFASLIIVAASFGAALYFYTSLRNERAQLEETTRELQTAKEEVEELRAATAEQKDRLAELLRMQHTEGQLTDQDSAFVENARFTVGMYSLGQDALEHSAVIDLLVGQGYTVIADQMLEVRPSWLAGQPAVLFYHSDAKLQSEELAEHLTKETGERFGVLRGAGFGVAPGEEATRLYIHYPSTRSASTSSGLVGYIWIGDYNSVDGAWTNRTKRAMLSTPEGEPYQDPPWGISAGTQFTVLGDMSVRAVLPPNNEKYYRDSRYLGSLRKGTAVSVLEPPQGVDRKFSIQYWMKVKSR